MIFILWLSSYGTSWGSSEEEITAGRAIAIDPNRGNCLACHAFIGGERHGNIAPPLIAMRLRYPSYLQLREQIWDAARRNPRTIMPPFGRHQILSEEEIDLVTLFIYNL